MSTRIILKQGINTRTRAWKIAEAKRYPDGNFENAVKIVVQEPGKKPSVSFWNGVGYIRCGNGTLVKIVCPGLPDFLPGKLNLRKP